MINSQSAELKLTYVNNLGNWEFPAGTMVMPLHWAINHDPKTWSQPELFRPHRFIDQDGDLVADLHLYPFQVILHRNVARKTI